MGSGKGVQGGEIGITAIGALEFGVGGTQGEGRYFSGMRILLLAAVKRVSPL